MKRYAIEKLRAWKKGLRRKPLLVQGARQVGKTWLLREFGRLEYANTAYINLAENEDAVAAFDGSLRVDSLVRKLSAASGEAIREGDTLIVLDEIQVSERALNALKFFRRTHLSTMWRRPAVCWAWRSTTTACPFPWGRWIS